MSRTKILALVTASVFTMAAVPSIAYGKHDHHNDNHSGHNNRPDRPEYDYTDSDKYNDLNQFTGRGDEKFDEMVNEDNQANTILDGKGNKTPLKDDHKSSLADDWKSGYDLKCVDWKIIGGCTWLKVRPYSVQVKHSFKVSHFSPDAIVEVFHNINSTPASYAALNNKIAKGLGNSIFSRIAFKHNKLNNTDSDGDGFHDLHVMGNPLIMLHDATIGTLYRYAGYCSSGAIPFMTYMHSFTDAEWRLGVWETINSARFSYQSLTNRGASQIVDYTSNPAGSLWGTLYPRIGETENPSPFIGAAVSALRAAVLVTSSSGIHSVLKISNTTTGKVFSNGEIDIQHGKWKVLLPKKFEGKQCSNLPLLDVSTYSGTNEPKSNTRNYVFQLWRNYQCCERKGTFISDY